MIVRKTYIAYFLILIGGIFARYFISLGSTSGDLDFYLGLGGYQISMLGVDKSSYFIFLNLFEDKNTKKLVLAIVMTMLNLLAVYSIQRNYKKTGFVDIVLAGFLSFFLIQIDMHLVRQQVGLYLFIYYIFSDNYKKYIALATSIYFHEVFIIFFIAHLIAPFISKYTRINAKHDLIIFAVLSIALYSLSGNISLILLFMISLLYLYLYNHNDLPYIYISSLLFMNFVLIFTGFEEVYLERFTGVIASYIMIFLLFNTNMINNFLQFRYTMKFTFLITYGFYFANGL